ncbi:hypothetical protein Y032_0238g3278 [Ancylostoma ceylanicum]|uniref:Glycosyl hydrolase family 25 n=1 Tax=Ancylostoma ceylanicum TaxID=53326 RepID=A0A016SF08_9BILA|nr:hypothetical protein Y032_0238g3278 [Ancylostoma ceylanicum]
MNHVGYIHFIIFNSSPQADLGVEVFMTPTRPSFNDGAEQFDQLYKGLQGCQINVASVWLQVVSPVDWMFQPQASVDFINQVIAQANNYGVNIGIYTSQKEWMEITYGTNDLYAPTRLWYWNVNSPGPLGETPANFSDFSAFGPWTSPVVKQFGQGIPICGHTVNRNIYIPSKILHGNVLQYSNHSDTAQVRSK